MTPSLLLRFLSQLVECLHAEDSLSGGHRRTPLDHLGPVFAWLFPNRLVVWRRLDLCPGESELPPICTGRVMVWFADIPPANKSAANQD